MLKNEPIITVAGLQQNRVLKFIIVGDSHVGKTCLTFRFCNRNALHVSEATIGVDFHDKEVKIGNLNVKLQLWDTAGQERFRKSMVQHYYRNAHAIVIVYDMTKISTFKAVAGWVDECTSHGLDKDIPRVLVGTHCDDVDGRVVTTATAQRLADHYGMPLFETSGTLDSELDTIDAIFMTLTHKIINELPFRVAAIDEERPYSIILPRSRSRNSRPLQNAENVKKCC